MSDFDSPYQRFLAEAEKEIPMCSDCSGDEYRELIEADARARRRAEKPEEPICDECGHPVSAHGPKYGCEHELGDAWVDGDNCGALMAQGPCGCTAVTVKCVHGTDTNVHINLFTGEIRCLACDEVLDIPELYEQYKPEMGKPYNLEAIL